MAASKPTVPATATRGPDRGYRVKSGDTLSKIAADHHIDTAQFFHQGLIRLITNVGGEDDFVDALVLQPIDFRLRCFGFIAKGGVRVGAGGVLGFASHGESDDPDFLATAFDDQRRQDSLRGLSPMEGRTGTEADIGAQHRCPAGIGMEEAHQFLDAGIGVIKFMVAQSKGVEADRIHQLGIGLSFGERVIEIAGAGVAAMQGQDIG